MKHPDAQPDTLAGITAWWHKVCDLNLPTMDTPALLRTEDAIRAHPDAELGCVIEWLEDAVERALRANRSPVGLLIAILEGSGPADPASAQHSTGKYIYGLERRSGKVGPRSESWLDSRWIPPQEFSAIKARPYLDEAQEVGGEKAWRAVWIDWCRQGCPHPTQYRPSFDFDGWLKLGAHADHHGRPLRSAPRLTHADQDLLVLAFGSAWRQVLKAEMLNSDPERNLS